MIVVTTPTGQIGAQVLDKVLTSDEHIRVIVRDPSRVAAKARERVEVVHGSHDDPDVVTKAFAGADTVFWAVPPNMRVQNVVDYYEDFSRPASEAIKAQGVKRVVAVSSLGRESGEVAKRAGHLTAAFAMDDLLEATGVSYRALRMPFFKENLLGQVRVIKSQGTFFLANTADRPLATCATSDVAAAATALLLDDSWSGQGSVPVAGPDDLSPNQMAQVMSEALQRTVRFQEISTDAYRTRMSQYGITEGAAQGMADMVTAQNDGIYDHETRTPPFAIPGTSFRQWCQDVLKPAVLS
ncbi:NAD(P)H-binding protein [Nonomuraea sp. NBC_00507]|uniref:NmrA family NAD(P)-binding protein n=1 Tax=Nonomuraea sp. NBC_00507 TaxID=2976002 RepID=UPI002E16EAA7